LKPTPPTCIKYFSLDVKTDLSWTATVITDKAALARLCNLNQIAVDPADGKIKCDQLLTTGTPDATSGLVACSYAKGDQCGYKSLVSAATFQEPCQCGYNAAGTSYCPKKQDDKASWTSLYSSQQSLYSNKCHTFSRFSCYLTTNLGSYAKAVRNTQTYAQFYLAADCVVKLMGASYIFTSLLAVATTLFAFIL